jgi:DNA-binding response OmpR family regulator
MEPSQGVPTILIADDNLQNVELLEAYLAGIDCEVRTAHDGEETLQAVQQYRPDLILLDVMMPKLSGFEVCRKVRANPETRETLILMVTALNEAGDFERGVQAGTDDFLTKPVNKLELLCRIKSLLRVRHLKSQLDRTLAYLAEVETESRAQ